MFAGLSGIPTSVIDGFATTICNKIHSCDSQVSVEDCKTDLLSDQDLQMARIFNDATLSCLGTCIAGKTCAELENINALVPLCGCECGFGTWCD